MQYKYTQVKHYHEAKLMSFETYNNETVTLFWTLGFSTQKQSCYLTACLCTAIMLESSEDFPSQPTEKWHLHSFSMLSS